MKKYLYIILLSTLTTTLFAQAPDRTAPPALLKAKNLQLPAIQKFKLSNGLSVILLEKHTVPLVDIKLLAKSGSFDDPAEKSGLTSFTLDLLDEGVDSLDALQLADAIEYLGASIGTFAGSFSSGITCSTPVSKLDASLKLMSLIALKPTFSEADIERVRKLKLNGLLQNYDDPRVIAINAYNKFLFDAATPYSKFPTEQSIKSFTRTDLMTLHQKYFVTDNSTLIIVGDVTKQKITPLLEKYFASYKKGSINTTAHTAPQQVKSRNIYFIDKPGAAQSVIRIGRIGASHEAPDYYNMVVMNTILGGSFASRLNTNLREEHGYSYGAGSGFSFWSIPGPFTASSSVQTDVTAPALNEFFNEFKKMLKPMPESDLSRGKNYVALGYAGDFETNSDIADALVEMVLYNLPDNYFNTYVDKILAVNKKGVEAAAKQYVVSESMLIVIVGDRAKTEESVKKLNLGKITFLTIEDVLGKKPAL